jgi:hypothetical protein
LINHYANDRLCPVNFRQSKKQHGARRARIVYLGRCFKEIA